MAIDITKKDQIQLDFCNGYAQTEVLKDVYPLVKTYKCVIKAGHRIAPETFSDKIQIFSFVKGAGYEIGRASCRERVF